MYRVGIDIGGTFTDMLLVGDDGTRRHWLRLLTTPGDPSLAVENALRPVLENGSVDSPRARHADSWHDTGDQRIDRAQRRFDGAPDDRRVSRCRRDRPRASLRALRSQSRFAQTFGAAPFALRCARALGRRWQRPGKVGRSVCAQAGRRAARQGHQGYRRLLSQQFSQSGS